MCYNDLMTIPVHGTNEYQVKIIQSFSSFSGQTIQKTNASKQKLLFFYLAVSSNFFYMPCFFDMGDHVSSQLSVFYISKQHLYPSKHFQSLLSLLSITTCQVDYLFPSTSQYIKLVLNSSSIMCFKNVIYDLLFSLNFWSIQKKFLNLFSVNTYF